MDIVTRLREACTGREVWRVADPETGAYCLAFDYTNSLRPESDARQWLAHHVAEYPDSRHANKVVIKVIERTDAEQLAHEAADEIERLRLDAARYRWIRHIDTGPAAIWEVVCNDSGQMTLKCGDDLDAAIDAAMKG